MLKKRIVLVSLSLCMGLICAELLVRLGFPFPSRLAKVTSSPTAIVQPTRQTHLSHHPEQGQVYVLTPTGRRLEKNIEAVIESHSLSGRRVTIRTNSQGMRNPEVGPKAGLRILFLGDSLVFADYLEEEFTFVRVVERLARQKGHAWETINAGVGSIDLRTELAILVETGLALKPDVVVLCHYLNDFQESPALLASDVPRAIAPSRFLTGLWAMFFAPRPNDDLTNSWRMDFPLMVNPSNRDGGEVNQALRNLALENIGDWGGAWSPHAWEIMTPLLMEFQRLAENHDFLPVVVSFPVSHQVVANPLDNWPQLQLAKVVKDAGIAHLDLLPLLRKEYLKGTPLFFDQCHHTEEASQILAESIFEFLDRTR